MFRTTCQLPPCSQVPLFCAAVLPHMSQVLTGPVYRAHLSDAELNHLLSTQLPAVACAMVLCAGFPHTGVEDALRGAGGAGASSSFMYGSHVTRCLLLACRWFGFERF